MLKFENVLLLQIFLKRDVEYCTKELERLKNKIGRDIMPCMHDKRHLALLFISNETPAMLVNRLRGVLEQDSINNYWVMIPLRNMVSKNGNLDSLMTRVGMAYAQIMNTGKPKNLAYSQPVRTKDRSKNTSVQVSVKRARSRHKSKEANSPNRS